MNSFVPLNVKPFLLMKKLFFLCVILSFLIDAYGGAIVTPGDSIHVKHYDIHITDIDIPEQTLVAVTTLQVISKVEGLTNIPLELMDLTVDSIYLEGAKVTDYTHSGTDLNIKTPMPYGLNSEITISVWYQGHPFHESWGGFLWNGDYAFNLGVGFVSQPHNLGKAWFPCVDDFTDRSLYDISVTVDDGLTVTSGGILMEKTTDAKGRSTWHWQMQHEIPTYLASVTVGEYVLYSDTYQGIEREIPIEIYTRPSEVSKVEGSFIHLHEVMDLYEEKWGAYPFYKIGYTGTAVGAMEHAGNIAFPHFAINGNLTYESLWAHELSHMWFGDATTCHDAEEMWVNEGWGKYNELFYTESIYDHATFIELMNDIHKTVLQYIHTTSGDGGYYALNNVPQDITYGVTSYEKGATVIHTLRNYLGDDVFFAAARHYLETYKYHDATSEQLRDAFAESAGINLDAFFNNWVFSPGTPGYTIHHISQEVKGSVEVAVTQKPKGRDFIGDDNIFELLFMGPNQEKETRMFSFDGEYGEETYTDIPFAPVAVIMDPDDKMMDASTDEGMVISSTGTTNFGDQYVKAEITNLHSDSIFLNATHYWVAPEPIEPPQPGLTLSNYRYWHIDGVFPEEIEGRLHFFYSKTNFLDDGIITDSNDSLVLLYRRDANASWSQITFSQFGPWSVGYLITEEIKKGDYTLAVWDDQYVTVPEIPTEKTGMLIYPNPSQGTFNFVISGNEEYIVEVFSGEGKKVFSCENVNNQAIIWDTMDAPAGTYTAHLVFDEQVVQTKKIVKAN